MGSSHDREAGWTIVPAIGGIGSVIAEKYRIERVLGQGGMGIVVAAKHLELGERVAIKFPIARVGDRAEVVARLLREGRAAMRIRSEHVARVYDVGALPSGQPYLVMEYLEGRDLRALLAERGRLPIDEAVDYVLQALEALAEAHARGIIHRDIKPSNLFLTYRPDGSPFIKVIDFGTSKIAESEATLTGDAAVVGSIPYMAPEQMRSAREMDARSDIWALGATLHTLLTGALPFADGTMLEIYERILQGVPPLRRFLPGAPAALEAILLRTMERDPARRYANVAELAQALAAVAPEHARISAARAGRILAGDRSGGGAAPRSRAGAIVAPSDPSGEAATVPPGPAPWATPAEELASTILDGAPDQRVRTLTPAPALAPPAETPSRAPVAGEVGPAPRNGLGRRGAFALAAVASIAIAGAALTASRWARSLAGAPPAAAAAPRMPPVNVPVAGTRPAAPPAAAPAPPPADPAIRERLPETAATNAGQQSRPPPKTILVPKIPEPPAASSPPAAPDTVARAPRRKSARALAGRPAEPLPGAPASTPAPAPPARAPSPPSNEHTRDPLADPN